MPCAVDECPRPIVARGLCENHYRRWRRHGDPVAGKAPAGEALAYFHSVMNDPHAHEGWPYGHWTEGGYGVVLFGGRQWGVHALACTIAHGPAPTEAHEVCHSHAGNKDCFYPPHLRWGTRVENAHDKRWQGGLKASLSEDDVRAIRRRLAAGDLQREVASDYGIKKATVSAINTRRNWSWVV